MNQIPDELDMFLQQQGLRKEHILSWVLCDRSLYESVYEETYVLLSKEALHVVCQRGGSRVVETTSVNSIESLTVVNLVASGMLVIKSDDGKEAAIAAFTNSRMQQAARLAQLFMKVKKQEPILPEDLAEDAMKDTCPTCGLPYPEKGRQVCPKCMKKHAIFGRLLSFAGKYKWSIFLIILFMLLNSVTSLAIPYFMGTVLFDQALGGSGTFAGQIGLVIAIIVAFRTLSLLFTVVFGIINARLAANVAFDLKASVFASLQRLSLTFFQKRQTGQLMTRVNNDAMDVQYFFTDGISYFIVNAMNIIGITIVMLVMDWKLTLLAFIPIPFILFLVRWVFPKLWRLSWRRYRRVSVMNSIISDAMRGTRVVKAFGKEHQEIDRFTRSSTSYAAVEQRLGQMASTIFPLLTFFMTTGGIIIWAFGGWQVMYGGITFGYVMTFLNYLFMLYGPIQFMNNIVNWWSRCMAAAQRIFEIHDAVPDIVEKANADVLDQIEGDIEVHQVTFGYEPNKPVLKDVSMRAKPGTMVGVVGHSGAGKSTLVNLISRLYDVNEGSITIDGVDVKDLSMNTLRKHIGIVSQEVYVFMGTIAENIAYANPECTLDDIIRAARIANAHDFIEKLPDGYDTVVGTGGYDLSGGEKQRISIARAVLQNPKILILDEATASLDTETELQIQEALEKLMKGRTTIAIAHRLSTLRNADYLVVIDKGKLTESGTHEELMEKNGIYAGMAKKHDEALKMRGVG